MLNTDSLLQFIRTQTGAHSIKLLDFRQLAGGAIQENHGLKVDMDGGSMPGEQHFVVRCDAPSSLSVSLSRSQEFEILELAWKQGVQAPRPFWLCTDTTILGSEFYVMQWAPGSASPRDLVGKDSLDAAQRKSLVFQLGQNLARLHQVKPTAQRATFLNIPRAGAAQHRLQEYRKILDELNEFHPAIELGLLYLERHAPELQDLTLCHGDFRTGNYLVAEGTLTAVLDWEFASWSDPYEDLGWLCSRSWRFGRPDNEVGGIGSKADLFEGYESVSGEAVDANRVLYWELMASVRWAVIALGQAHRHVSGQQKSLELVLTGNMLPEIQFDLMRHLRDVLAVVHDGDGVPPLGAVRPVATAGQVAGGARPNASALLTEARSVLLVDVLAALPSSQHYNARMIANAMAISIREAEQGAQIGVARQDAIDQFYENVGHDLQGADASRLAQDIRAGRFGNDQQHALLQLIDILLHYDLLISNPRKIESA